MAGVPPSPDPTVGNCGRVCFPRAAEGEEVSHDTQWMSELLERWQRGGDLMRRIAVALGAPEKAAFVRRDAIHEAIDECRVFAVSMERLEQIAERLERRDKEHE